VTAVQAVGSTAFGVEFACLSEDADEKGRRLTQACAAVFEGMALAGKGLR
jgi:hypothetical protein